LWIGAAGCLYFGLYTELPYQSAQSIATALLSSEVAQ
jgi:hypothetical protein